jgi:hypothetical protein
MPTTVFDTITKLVEIATAAFAAESGLSDFTVFDGGPIQDLPPNTFHVGFEPRDALAADAKQSRMQGFGSAREESFEIPCTLYAESGDTDMAAVRAKAKLAYQTIETALQADQSLGGTVELAVMGSRIIYNQPQFMSGAGTQTQFTVLCQAYPDNP